MNFCNNDDPKCVYEKMKTLSTETIVTLRDVCKTVVNERYSKRAPITKSITCPDCNGTGMCLSVSEKNTSLNLCDTCKGYKNILINVQNNEQELPENFKVMKEYNIVQTLLECNKKYPAGTFWIGYPETKVEDTNTVYQGITFNDKDSIKFRDRYENFRGYSYFKWVVIDNIDTNEYSVFSLDTHKKLVKTIRTYLGATEYEDIIISYKNKTYFAAAQYSLTLFGSSILVTYKELINRLTNRIEIEHRKHKTRTMTLGFSCIDTGKTIYVGSDECHSCKCYDSSVKQNINCKIHKLDK